MDFIKNFALDISCKQHIIDKLFNEYSAYIEMIKPQLKVSQGCNKEDSNHNRYNHQVLAGLIALTIFDVYPCEQERLIVSALLIHDYGHIAFSHTMERFIRQYIKPDYSHEHWSIKFMLRLIKPQFQHLVESSRVDIDRLSYLIMDYWFLRKTVHFDFKSIMENINSDFEFNPEFVQKVLDIREYAYQHLYPDIDIWVVAILEKNKDTVTDLIKKNIRYLPRLADGTFLTDEVLLDEINSRNLLSQ